MSCTKTCALFFCAVAVATAAVADSEECDTCQADYLDSHQAQRANAMLQSWAARTKPTAAPLEQQPTVFESPIMPAPCDEKPASLPAVRKSATVSEAAAGKDFEKALGQMYSALPKQNNGNLEARVVRYALHRFFLQQHRWFIKGLDSNVTTLSASGGKTNAARNASAALMNEWLDLLHQREHEMGGITFEELRSLAHFLEDMVHRETHTQVDTIYNTFNLGKDHLLSEQQAFDFGELYLLLFLTQGDLTFPNASFAMRKLRAVKRSHPKEWHAIEGEMIYPLFLDLTNVSHHDVVEPSEVKLAQKPSIDAHSVGRLAETITENFGEFSENGCLEVKELLISMEGTNPGRVPLADFYKKALANTETSKFVFNEKVDFLRVLGALDESNATTPQVIVPNYLESRSNCRLDTGFYSICCPSQCEDLMGELERQLVAPFVEPHRILKVVEEFSGAKVSVASHNRLQALSELDGGRVPLHGQPFAEWLHQVFPHDCRFPHTAGTMGSLAVDEWLASMGHDNTTASEEEMVCYINHPENCGGPDGMLSRAA